MRNHEQRPSQYQHHPIPSSQGNARPTPTTPNYDSRHDMSHDHHSSQIRNRPIQSKKPALNGENDYGIKFVAYGGKAAFQIGDSETKEGKHTILIESANKLNPNDRNDRKLDWQNKVCFQLTVNELPVFIAVMYGFIKAARFDSHGACNTKFLDVVNQGDKFFFKSGAKDVPLKVAPVGHADATHFGMVALNSYCKNFASLSSQSVMDGVKVMTKRLLESKQIKQPSNH